MSAPNPLDFVPLLQHLEAIGGSKAFEEDPAAFREALHAGWPESVSKDSDHVTHFIALTEKPVNHEDEEDVNLLSYLRDFEKLGGAKNFEKFAQKPIQPASISAARKDLEAYDSTASGKLRLTYGGLSTTVNLFVKLGGYGWRFTGNWYYYGNNQQDVDGTLNYTSYRGLRPDLTFDQGDFYIQLFPGPSAHSQDHRNGAYVETYYKEDRDHNPNPLATFTTNVRIGDGDGWGYGAWSIWLAA